MSGLRDELHRIGDAAPTADVPGDTWARARRSRRRDRAIVLSGGVAVVALAAGLAAWLPTSGERPVASSGPDRVRVTCSDAGIAVSETTIEARPGGVALVVSSSMAKGSYLTYTSDGGGVSGGDPIPQGPKTWTLPLAPGDLALTCAPPGDVEPSAPAHVIVTDPHGYWRGESLSEFGCGAGGAIPSWISGLSGTGDTPEQAVDETLANFTRLVPGTYAAQPAEVGYVGASTQTWVATKNGRPNMTILVSETGASFSAGPDSLCGPG